MSEILHHIARVTAPDGTELQRTSKGRTYTHCVICQSDEAKARAHLKAHPPGVVHPIIAAALAPVTPPTIVTCGRCHEEHAEPWNDPDVQSTDTQWQCPTCGSWEDRP